jgi:hypothetical protein
LKGLLAFLLSLMMVMVLLPTAAFGESTAALGESTVPSSALGAPLSTQASGDPITVSFSYADGDGGGFVLAKHTIEVTPNYAETFGYTEGPAVTDDQVTMFDAIVAAFYEIYEEDVTDVIGQSGSAITIDGSISFLCYLNYAFAAKDDLGQPWNEAILSEGDYVALYGVQETYMYTDGLTWFEDSTGSRIDEITVELDEEIDLNLWTVWGSMWYEPPEPLEDHADIVEDGIIVSVDVSGTPPTGIFDEELAVTDVDGLATVSFDAPGTYVLSAYVDDDNDYWPLSSPWLEVTVLPPAYQPILEASLAYLASSVPRPVPGSQAGDWSVLALARGEADLPDSYWTAYLNRVKTLVRTNAGADGRLDASYSTENSRTILALTSIGVDATDVAGVDLVSALTDTDWVELQGVNGAIYALLALDSAPYLPDDTTTRDALIQIFLDNQLPTGGWTWFGDDADDLTASALQALASYYGQGNDDLDEAVDDALAALSDLQSASGGFVSWGAESPEFAAQVVVALSALGIDADTDAAFVKANGSALDALLAYAVEGGGFYNSYSGPTTPDAMSTDQGTYALVAYDRFLNTKTRLYDMSDVESYVAPAIPEGVAVNLSVAHAPGKSVDISSSSTAGGALPVLYDSSTRASERFRLEPDGEGYYTIVNVNSGLVLDIYGGAAKSGAQVIQWPAKAANADNQKWAIDAVDGGFIISAKKDSNLVLDVKGSSTANGAQLLLWNRSDDKPNQTFNFETLEPLASVDESTTYLIHTLAGASTGDRVLDIYGASHDRGAAAILWGPNGHSNQDWTFTFDDTTGYYTIEAAHSGHLLDVYGASKTAGASIIQWPATGRLNQSWALLDAGDGAVYIQSAMTGYSLDISGNNSASGAAVIAWTHHGRANQTWVLE